MENGLYICLRSQFENLNRNRVHFAKLMVLPSDNAKNSKTVENNKVKVKTDYTGRLRMVTCNCMVNIGFRQALQFSFFT